MVALLDQVERHFLAFWQDWVPLFANHYSVSCALNSLHGGVDLSLKVLKRFKHFVDFVAALALPLVLCVYL